MTFTPFELAYLDEQRLGRLATVQSDGAPQVSPVGFSYNPELGTIDIGGFPHVRQSGSSATWPATAGWASWWTTSSPPTRGGCAASEIRGRPRPSLTRPARTAGADAPTIRIHPRRIISFGIDQSDVDPHLLVANKRDVA